MTKGSTISQHKGYSGLKRACSINHAVLVRSRSGSATDFPTYRREHAAKKTRSRSCRSMDDNAPRYLQASALRTPDMAASRTTLGLVKRSFTCGGAPAEWIAVSSPRGAEFLDAETRRQKSLEEIARSPGDRKSGTISGKIPTETAYRSSAPGFAVSEDWMVEPGGIEPPTSSLRTTRSPS